MHSVICNTSPLGYLHSAGLLYLLPEIYGEIIVPAAVAQEFKRGEELHNKKRPQLAALPWVNIQTPAKKRHPLLLSLFNLGPGETQAIMLGLSAQDARLVLDDLSARRCAHKAGLAVTGTAGVLIAAKQQGLLAAVKPSLDHMIFNDGFYLSADTYQECLALAGEEYEPDKKYESD